MLIALYGKSGSGKSTIAKELYRKYGISRLVTSTSREKRKGESDDVDYHFLTKEDFENDSNNFIALTNYMDNYYGINANDMARHHNTVKVVVLDPKGISELSHNSEKYDSKDIYMIYIDVNDEDREYFLKTDKSRFPNETEERIKNDDVIFTEDKIGLANKIIHNNSSKSLCDVTKEVLTAILDFGAYSGVEIERKWVLSYDSYADIFSNYTDDKISVQHIVQKMDGYRRYRDIDYPPMSFIQTKDKIYKDDDIEVKFERTNTTFARIPQNDVAIRKTRYSFEGHTNVGDITFTLDQFHERYDQLFMLEIEFPTITQAKKFDGRIYNASGKMIFDCNNRPEVTMNPHFSNRKLFTILCDADNGDVEDLMDFRCEVIEECL